MKKLFLSILLLCCCVVFTGCGGNSNSYDESEADAYRITVSDNIINQANNTVSTARSASSDKKEVKLFLNGVEFPGHSFDTDGNYIFTKVMYATEVAKMAVKSSYTIKLVIEGNSNPTEIVFEKQPVLPRNIMVKKIDSNNISMFGDNGDIDAFYYNGVEQAGLTKVKDIKIEKLNSLTAKVTFLNALGNGVLIDYDYWKITATKLNGESVSWSSNQNGSNINLLITPSENGNSDFYTITLTSKGEDKIGSHSLDNTYVKIDDIKKNGENGVSLLPSNVLSKAYLQP